MNFLHLSEEDQENVINLEDITNFNPKKLRRYSSTHYFNDN